MGKIVAGVIMIAVGLAAGIWSWIHRPVDVMRNLADTLAIALENPDFVVLKPVPFYVIMLFVVVMLFFGVKKIIAGAKEGKAAA